MNIGIYEDHSILITNLDRVKKHYACAECQARFTQTGSLRACRGFYKRGNQSRVPWRKKIWSPETAYEKAFYGKGAYSGKAVSWMEHDARRRGVHIYHQMCGHVAERKVAGEYLVDVFFLKTNTVFQFHRCHWHGCPKYYPTQRKKVVAFEKNKARETNIDKRHAVFTNARKD